MGLASSLKSRVAKLGKSVVQGHRASTDAYVAHLKNIGVKMGDDVVIFSPGRTNIDEQNPHLLSFGSHVAMTGPVTILTHDYSVGVTKVWTHGEILGSQKPVSIGSNVFLGWGCTVLPGTTIGDNCIVGAGSVVSGNVEGGSVWGGFLGNASAPWRNTMSAESRSSSRRRAPSIASTRSVSLSRLPSRSSTSTSTYSPRARMGFARGSGRSSTTTRTRTSACVGSMCTSMLLGTTKSFANTLRGGYTIHEH